jgi:hypothetical protein
LVDRKLFKFSVRLSARPKIRPRGLKMGTDSVNFRWCWSLQFKMVILNSKLHFGTPRIFVKRFPRVCGIRKSAKCSQIGGIRFKTLAQRPIVRDGKGPFPKTRNSFEIKIVVLNSKLFCGLQNGLRTLVPNLVLNKSGFRTQ